MRNTSRAIGSKRLNKLIGSYDQCYFSLHEGYAGTDPGDIADQAGTSLVASPDTATTGQWTDKPGYWSGTSTNAADGLVISRSDDPTNFDLIFNLSNTVLLQALYVFADTDPSAAGRVVSLANPNPDFDINFEIKYLTGGQIQMLVDGDSSSAAQTAIDLPAEGAPNEAVIIHVLDTINDTATIYAYTPGTKTIAGTATSDISAIGLDTSIPSNQAIYLGRSVLAGGGATNWAKNISIRDYRAINFGGVVPTDLSAIIEEIAVNSSLGSRR